MKFHIPNLEERKLDLIKTLKSLKGNKLSENKFSFISDSNDLQEIDTKLDFEVNGIAAGQFISFVSQSGIYSNIFICVGIGKGSRYDKDNNNFYLWFLKEGDRGITYFKNKDMLTKEKLEEEVKKYFKYPVSLVVL